MNRRDRDRLHYSLHREEILAKRKESGWTTYQRQWQRDDRARNPEREQRKARAHYLRNRERILAKQKAAREAGKKPVLDHGPQSDPEEEAARLAMLRAVNAPAMTYEEIGAALGITRARVGQLVQTALRKLRRNHPEIVEWLVSR